jgi:hypothetical protein
LRRCGSLARLIVSIAIAIGGTTMLARTAAAECDGPPPPRTTAGYVGYGFEAYVTGVDRGPSSAPFDWTVVLDVAHVYQGAVPSRLAVSGWSYRVSCGLFHGEFLRPGDEIMVTSDVLTRHQLGVHTLAWRKADIGWMWDDQLIHSHDSGIYSFIPPTARLAATTREIVAIMRGGLPATATMDRTRASSPLLIALLPGAAVAFLFLRRRSHGVTRAGMTR